MKPHPSQELLQSCHAHNKQYSRRSQAPLFQPAPVFFSAAVEMSDQYFLTWKVILGLAETIAKIVCLEPIYNIRSVALLVRPLILLSTDLEFKTASNLKKAKQLLGWTKWSKSSL